MGVIKWLGTTSGDVGVTTNYSTSALPVNGDDLYVEANPSGTDVSMSSNLSALSGVTLASLNVSQNFSKSVGTTAAYLQIGASNCSIGYSYTNSSSQSGPALVRVNFGSVQHNTTVFNSAGTASTGGVGPISLLGTHANNTLNILSGSVTMAIGPGETSTLLTVNNSGSLFLGSGVTLTTVTGINGYTLVRSAVTTLNIIGGQVETEGSGAITTINLSTGTGTLNSAGTITTLNVYGGTASFAGNPTPRTVTTANIYGGSLNINNGVKGSITFTNPVHTFGTSYRLINVPGTSFAFS